MKKSLLSRIIFGNLLQVGVYGLMLMVVALGLTACDSKSDILVIL